MTRRQETTRSYINAVKERWKNSRLATIPIEVLRAQQSSTLATLITFAEHAVMPCFVLGVDRTEPPPTSLAVICSSGIARFVHRRYRLTRRHNVPGFCLTLLLQHSPPYP